MFFAKSRSYNKHACFLSHKYIHICMYIYLSACGLWDRCRYLFTFSIRRRCGIHRERYLYTMESSYNAPESIYRL